MPSWKEKTGRLQAFARHKSDSHNPAVLASGEAQAVMPERPPERPASFSGNLGQSRYQLAEAARIPLPSGLRNGHGGQHDGQQARPHTPPPKLVPQQSPPRRRDPATHADDMFSGSQLGDDFMKSVISTPKNEEEGDVEEVTPNARLGSGRQAEARPVGYRGNYPTGDFPIFDIDENLMMSVVPRNRVRTPLHVMDGFQEETVNENKSKNQTALVSSSHTRPVTTTIQPKLPLREVRIKRLPPPVQSPVRQQSPVRPQSPARQKSPVRQPRNVSRSSSPAHHGHVKEQRSGGRVVEEAAFDEGSVEEAESAEEYRKPEKMPEPRKVRDHRRPAEGNTAPVKTAIPKILADKKRRRGSVDYDDKLLSSMAYRDLHEEPFDADPAKATSQKGHDASAKLPVRLEQFRHQGRKEQLHFFAKMSLDDWEASGDWFVDEFTNIMKKLRDARCNKRRTMRAFEDEAARREEAVRLRSESIDRRLVKMKQDGLRVVAGAL